MSFFDEPAERQTGRGAAPRRAGSSGRGRRRPPSRQTIVERRAVAAVAILALVVQIALGLRSCQVSARNSSLKDYNSNVSALIQHSDQTGSQLFGELARGDEFNAATVESQIDQARGRAEAVLAGARSIDVPGEVGAVQRYVLWRCRCAVTRSRTSRA
jgi:hypothetical protein